MLNQSLYNGMVWRNMYSYITDGSFQCKENIYAEVGAKTDPKVVA